MPDLKPHQIERYLSSVLGAEVSLLGMKALGDDAQTKDVKGFGYGTPVKVDFLLDNRPRTAVLHTMSPGPFGHEHMADRAQELIWEHSAFNHLPRHVRSLDLCGFQPGGDLLSLSNVEEFCLLTDYVEGETYAHDLEHIRDTGEFGEPDLARAYALCDYLVQVHAVPGADPGLYIRRIRELVGHGECIMGVADSYPPHDALAPAGLLEEIEHLCVSWRWRLKSFPHRLRQVHGDFHPWNILFRAGVDFSVLDRSRGEYGDPADDVASLSMNYLFFSLQRSGRLDGPFKSLFQGFWRRYLEQTGDREMLQVIAPFFAFRGLVMASPVWYPALPGQVRKTLLTFILSVLESETFDPENVTACCGF